MGQERGMAGYKVNVKEPVPAILPYWLIYGLNTGSLLTILFQL